MEERLRAIAINGALSIGSLQRRWKSHDGFIVITVSSALEDKSLHFSLTHLPSFDENGNVDA